MTSPTQRSLPFGSTVPTSSVEESAEEHAAQLLLHVLPAGEESRVSSMLEVGLHSAELIAGLTKKEFLEQWTTLYADEEELGELIYKNAVATRAQAEAPRFGASRAHDSAAASYVTAQGTSAKGLLKARDRKGRTAAGPRTAPLSLAEVAASVDHGEGLYLMETFRRYQRPRDGMELARLRLGLSAVDARRLFTPCESESEVAALWHARDHAELQSLLAGELPTLLRKLELSRKELQALLYQDVSDDEFSAGVACTFFLNQDLEHDDAFLMVVAADPDDPSDPPDLVRWSDGEPLGLRQLDRLMRFAQLMRRLDLTAAELDWLLRSNLLTELDDQALLALAVAFELRARSGLPFDEVCALWSTPKQHGQGDGIEPTALFDRIFNAGCTVSLEAVLAAGLSDLLSYRLLAASRLSRADYATLTNGLAARGFAAEPTLEYAGLLYRMVALSRLLDVRVGDLLDLLDVLDAKYQPEERAALGSAGAAARPSYHALAHPQEGGSTASALLVLQRVLALTQWANLRQVSARQLAYLCLERGRVGAKTRRQASQGA